MIQFFLVFTILILIGGSFSVGWNGITRGWVEYLPDGTKFNAGQILGGWERFWEYKKGVKRIYYNHENLCKKLFELNYLDKKIGSKLIVSPDRSDSLETKEYILDEEILKIEKLLGCKLFFYNGRKGSEDRNYVTMYIEMPVYRFTEWVRKPISSCIRCYASVYGSFIWWAFVYLQKDAFNWCSNKIIAILTFWFIFMVILSGVNVFFNKKMKE